MTPNTNIAATYQGTKVNTASPAELTLMLYEGAIKFCNKGIYAIEDKNINKANENLLRAQKIIMELRGTLDFKYPVAKDFELVYDYIYRRLVEAYIKKDKDIVEDALKYIRDMRDTWKEVMRANKMYVK